MRRFDPSGYEVRFEDGPDNTLHLVMDVPADVAVEHAEEIERYLEGLRRAAVNLLASMSGRTE